MSTEIKSTSNHSHVPWNKGQGVEGAPAALAAIAAFYEEQLPKARATHDRLGAQCPHPTDRHPPFLLNGLPPMRRAGPHPIPRAHRCPGAVGSRPAPARGCGVDRERRTVSWGSGGIWSKPVEIVRRRGATRTPWLSSALSRIVHNMCSRAGHALDAIRQISHCARD
jgi:hypothetical protein